MASSSPERNSKQHRYCRPRSRADEVRRLTDEGYVHADMSEYNVSSRTRVTSSSTGHRQSRPTTKTPGNC